ncbi:MAG: hypothetical protein IT423_24615, partial [Pirellulaceae bacterium]|nr:hypothetical protein [Pirellulaceae bacterium]
MHLHQIVDARTSGKQSPVLMRRLEQGLCQGSVFGLRWCGILWLMLSSVVMGQTVDTPTWEAMRIFVPEGDVDKVVTTDYLTVPLAELERLLAEDARRRLQSASQAAGIQRATYVARWSDQVLASRASMWQVALPGNSQPLNIGRTSLAIEEPLGLASELTPLTRHLRYVDDQRLKIVGNESQSEFWFGFTSKTRRRDSGQHTLELAVPKAVLATMLVAVPLHTTLTSNLPCAPVEQIGRFLPEAWPMATIPTISAEERWYVVWLSGRDGCTLNFTPASKSSQFPYRLAVARAQCDTVVSPSGLQVNARFQLAKPPVSGSVRVQLDEPLHVRSVFVDGVQVSNWKSIPEEDRQPDPQNNSDTPPVPRAKIQVIEVACNTAGANPLVVAVEAIGRIPLPFDGPLPRVEIADSYVMDGRCTLVSK